MKKMRWYAGRGRFGYSPEGHWVGCMEDGTRIEVHPKLYDEQFDAYLERLGVKRTSWYEIMQKAEQEWQTHSKLMDEFAENLEQWLTLQHQGFSVIIERPRIPIQADEKR